MFRQRSVTGCVFFGWIFLWTWYFPVLDSLWARSEVLQKNMLESWNCRLFRKMRSRLQSAVFAPAMPPLDLSRLTAILWKKHGRLTVALVTLQNMLVSRRVCVKWLLFYAHCLLEPESYLQEYWSSVTHSILSWNKLTHPSFITEDL